MKRSTSSKREGKMMKINVAEIIGTHCTEYEQGDRVFSILKTGLDAGDLVDVDMQGVQLATSAFFNAALGPLHGMYTIDVLNTRVKFSHLSKEMRQVIARSLEATKKFYEEQKPA